MMVLIRVAELYDVLRQFETHHSNRHDEESVHLCLHRLQVLVLCLNKTSEFVEQVTVHYNDYEPDQ